MRIITLMPAMLVVGFSSVAFGAVPAAPPAIYDNGPALPLYAVTDLSDAERAAYALYEAVLQVAQAKVHATSCASSLGSYPIDIFTNGRVESDPDRYNSVTVASMNGEFTLDAELKDKVDFRGQQVLVSQDSNGELDDRGVKSYSGIATYNEFNNMALQHGSVKVIGSNGRFNLYHSKVIKDFYNGDGDEAYAVFDWGVQVLNKLGYPVSKYWVRAKSRRSDGEIGRTVFVKDRLVGPTSCRIAVDTEGFNTEDFFWQDGYLIISMDDPGVPVAELSDL